MKNRILLLLAIVAAACITGSTEPISSVVITVTAGTAIRVTTAPTKANSIFFQMVTGGTGRGYVLYANPNVTCAKDGAGTAEVAELLPASSTAPGGNATFPSNGEATQQSGGADVNNFCIDGSHSGDTILVSWDRRN